jgi:hypothetical protein
MDGPPIFICHSSKDQKVAEAICGALEARGFRCWIACRDVAPGENYQEAIVGALRASRLAVLVFTGNANNSDEIKKELSLAGRHHATVIPVRAEDVAPNDALSYELATRQWIDLFSGWDRGIERLSEQIWRSLGTVPGRTGQQPFQAFSPVSGKEQSRYPLAIALSIVAVSAIVAGAYLLSPFAKMPTAPAPQVTLQAIDEREWAEAASSGSIQPIKLYLDHFPKGIHVADAQRALKKADEAAWGDASDIATTTSFNAYLSRFPDGAHAAQVAARIAELERQAVDDKAWSTARISGSRAAFDEYLKAYPSGIHVAEAFARISEIDASRTALCKARYPTALSAVPPQNTLACKQVVMVLDGTCGPGSIKRVVAGCSEQNIPRQTFCVACDPSFGRFGINFSLVTQDIANRMNLPQARGILLTTVSENGAAKAAGIRPGDVVVMMDGKELKENDDLYHILSATPAGKKIDVVIIRDGKELTLPVTFVQ